MPSQRRSPFPRQLLSFPLLFLITLLLAPTPSHAIKFSIQAYRYPPVKCIWNTAHTNALVIVTANVSPQDPEQRVDIEIVDDSKSSDAKRVYLSKKNIQGETRLAITTHAEGEVGVCFKNTLDANASSKDKTKFKVIDLDVDIGADAVDYNAIANQESLSTLEVEMRKIEGITKEIVEELGYLERREKRFANTNLSTNERVSNFAWFTLFSLTGLGVWQIFHLRAFFRRKYLID